MSTLRLRLCAWFLMSIIAPSAWGKIEWYGRDLWIRRQREACVTHFVTKLASFELAETNKKSLAEAICANDRVRWAIAAQVQPTLVENLMAAFERPDAHAPLVIGIYGGSLEETSKAQRALQNLFHAKSRQVHQWNFNHDGLADWMISEAGGLFGGVVGVDASAHTGRMQSLLRDALGYMNRGGLEAYTLLITSKDDPRDETKDLGIHWVAFDPSPSTSGTCSANIAQL